MGSPRQSGAARAILSPLSVMLAGRAGPVELAAAAHRRRAGACSEGPFVVSRLRAKPVTGEILRHWREAVPNDRLAHLVKDVARGLARALQMRLTEHAVSYGHWTFLRILWETEGVKQRRARAADGAMGPNML